MDYQGSADAGPKQRITQKYSFAEDGSTPFNITNTIPTRKKAVITDLIISVDTACHVTVQMETSENVLAGFHMPANGTVQITPRGYLKADTPAKKIQVVTDVAAAIDVTCCYFKELV